jgi:uncharacterized membrane protein (DUF106 family)
MNALRKDENPQFQPVKTRKLRQRHRLAASSNSHIFMITETTLKLGVNIFLSSVAIVSLLQLLSYHSTQKNKLEEINKEVNKTQIRVEQLRNAFGRNFDPKEVKKVIQDQNNVIAPNQLRVVIQPKTEAEKQTQISQNR